MTLLRQIQDAAIDSSTDLPTLLRKCKVLAARLGSDEFKRWIQYELLGYPDGIELPDYRVLTVYSKGHFSGAFGSGLRDADIPLLCVPEEIRESLGHCHLVQPVAALEALVSQDSNGTVQEPWNPDLVAHLGQQIYARMNCLQAWKVIPKVAVVAAIDAVRTRVLNFVLEIEAQDPSAGEAAPNSNPIPMERVHQIFNTYITGTVQNLAPGSSNVTQTAKYAEQVGEDLLAKLIDTVRSAALPDDVTRTAISSLECMQEARDATTFKQRYQAFMSVLADHIQVLGPVVAPLLPALSMLVP